MGKKMTLIYLLSFIIILYLLARNFPPILNNIDDVNEYE